MLDIFAQYATDEAAENEGVWVPHGSAKFLIARAGNRKYVKKLSALVEKNQKLLDAKDDAADKLSDQLMIEVMAESILLGWENVGYKGETLPYSLENAKMLLGVKDFRREVSKMADDINNFKVKQTEEQQGN